LIGPAAKDDEGGNFEAAGGKLRAFAHGGGLLEHVAANFGVEHHGFVDARGVGFAAGIPRHGGIAGGVNFDVVLADPDRIAVVQRGAFHAHVVNECAVEAVEIFDHKATGFEVHAGMVVGDGEIVHREIVVRRTADAHGATADGNFLDQFFFKHQAELRHIYFPPA